MSFVEGLESRQLLAAVPQTSTHNWAVTSLDVAVDDLGRTITAGLYRTHQQIGVTRVNADGTVDKTFGKNGIATLVLADKPRTSDGFEIAVDHTGRVLVGIAKKLMRLRSSGTLDVTFGSGGALTVPVLTNTGDVIVDKRNRPIVVGTAKGKTGNRATIVRLGERGALDTGFGIGGAYKTPVPADPQLGSPGNATGITAKVFADGTIVGIARYTSRADYGGGDARDYQGISAFRLLATGALDTTYGTAGATLVQQSSSEIYVRTVYFGSFNADGGLTIATSTTTYSAGDPTEKTTRTRLDVNGKIGGA